MIKLIKDNKNKYMDLLLLADPDRSMIKSYIDKGDLFVLFKDTTPISASVVVKVDNSTCEIKNIATYEEYQQQGFGRKLINYIFKFYKNKFEYILVATGNSSINNIKFYESCGFKYYKTIDNFFLDNYSEPIFEDGIQCIDSLYFKKIL